MIRVLVADDHPIVRGGIVGLLGAANDIEVVGEAADGAMAVRLAEELCPDLVLMDLRMPHLDGAAATAAILAQNPATRVLILTTYESDDQILAPSPPAPAATCSRLPRRRRSSRACARSPAARPCWRP